MFDCIAYRVAESYHPDLPLTRGTTLWHDFTPLKPLKLAYYFDFKTCLWAVDFFIPNLKIGYSLLPVKAYQPFLAQLMKKRKIDSVVASSSQTKICMTARCCHGLGNVISNFLNSVFVKLG